MKLISILLIFVITSTLSCFNKDEPGRYDTFDKNIQIGDVPIVETRIHFKAGELSVIPTTENYLLKGTFSYYREGERPEINYEENNNKGYLEILSHDELWDRNFDDEDKIEWHIALNKDIANDLSLKAGAGEVDIDLQDCNIRRFDFEMGAGEAHINLRNTSVADFSFDGGAGEVKIDLSGEWKNDLDAKIDGGVGEITLILPSDVGIEMEISGLLGERNVPGFFKEGSHYTNRLLGKTKNNLYLDINGGIGTVNVITEY